MKLQEQFNPANSQYKKVEDLPKEEQENFEDVEGGGFVKKEAVEKLAEAEKIAEIANTLSRKKERKITGVDILHSEAIGTTKKEEKIKILQRIKHIKPVITTTDMNRAREVIKNIPLEFWNDKDVVFAVAKVDSRALKYASPELRNDKEFVLKLVRDYSCILKYASPEFWNDKDMVLAAVKGNGHALEYASPELRNDKDIVFVAVSWDRSALEFASSELRNDKEFVLRLVRDYYGASKYASIELRNDKDVVLLEAIHNRKFFKDVPPELWDDEEFVLKLIRHYDIGHFEVRIDKLISKRLLNNAEFILEEADKLLYYASKRLLNDEEFILKAIDRNGYALGAVPKHLWHYKKFVLRAANQYYGWNAAHTFFLHHVSLELRNDKDVVLAAVKQDGRALEYASPELRNDKDVVLAAVTESRDAFPYINDSLKEQIEKLL